MSVDFPKSLEHKLQDGVLKKSELRTLENQARKTPDTLDDAIVTQLKSQFKAGDKFHLVDLKLGGIEIKALPAFDFVDDLSAPTAAEIKAGKAVIGADPQLKQEGPAVKTVQHRLKQLGYAVNETGVMDNKTVAAIKSFQAVTGCSGEHKDKSGQIGATTWKRLNQMSETQEMRQKMVATAQTNCNSSYSTSWVYEGTKSPDLPQKRCYVYVAHAADSIDRGGYMTGNPAYGATDGLKKDPRYQEITVSEDQLKNLLPGTIVVWEQGTSENGHISIADGKHNEISDFIKPQATTHWGEGGYHVFLPVK